jgi:hypothetical protein
MIFLINFIIYLFFSIFKMGPLILASKLVQKWRKLCIGGESHIHVSQNPPKLAIKRWFVVFYSNFISPLFPFSRGGGSGEDPIICQYSIIFHKEKNRKLETY